MEGFWRGGGAARTEAGEMRVTTGKFCVLGPFLKLDNLAIVMVKSGSILTEYHLTNRAVMHVHDVFFNAVITKHSAV